MIRLHNHSPDDLSSDYRMSYEGLSQLVLQRKLMRWQEQFSAW